MNTAALFVDGAAARIEASQANVQLDCKRLREWASRISNASIVESYWFDATSTGLKTAFHRALSANAYRVNIHEIHETPLLDARGVQICNAAGQPIRQRKQVGVDVALGLELMRSHRRSRWTSLVLVAGDGDLIAPVRELVEIFGVTIILVGNSRARSHLLIPFAHQCVDFAEAAQHITQPRTPLLLLESATARANRVPAFGLSTERSV